MTIYETNETVDADELEYPELYESLGERRAMAAIRGIESLVSWTLPGSTSSVDWDSIEA
jgi:hypothetical protein